MAFKYFLIITIIMLCSCSISLRNRQDEAICGHRVMDGCTVFIVFEARLIDGYSDKQK